MNKTTKRILTMVLTCILILFTVTGMVDGKSKSNKQIAIDYCKSYCKSYNVKVVDYNKVPVNRVNGNVYIEKVVTKSIGKKHGKTKDGYKVKYSKKVKKGKKVTMYFVYNPTNNNIDDIICVVDNKHIRGDFVKIK